MMDLLTGDAGLAIFTAVGIMVTAVSIVRDTTFKPSFGPNNSTFRMVDLLLFAFEEKKALLAPLG